MPTWLIALDLIVTTLWTIALTIAACALWSAAMAFKEARKQYFTFEDKRKDQSLEEKL